MNQDWLSARRLLGRVVFVSVLAAAAPAPIEAAPISLTISGTIASIEGNLDTHGAFAPGDTFSLTYTVDSGSPDSDMRTWVGTYFQFGMSPRVDVRLGTWFASGVSSDHGAIQVANDIPPSSPEVAGWDIYLAYSFSHFGQIGEPLGEFWFNAFWFQFSDTSGTAFTSDALDQAGLDLSRFDGSNSWIGFNTASDTADVHLTAHSISVQTVPEPASIGLVALGLAGANCFRRRGRR
jgi:hypothetical protein